ncbi:MAG TPA: phosphoribosylanthranilate isomerase [Thermoplasmata archaeon]|nr:phosphoribosylanthranilate isomerase [Thermoplasmata archaeon]
MKTFVKFCGLRDAESVREVPAGGAAGFVVEVPTSPRNLSLDAATALIDDVPTEAEAWAVVVDPTPELIHRLFDEVGVDRVQVYGAVPAGLEFLEVHHLVPSMPIGALGSGAPVPPVPAAEDYPRVHLDAAGQPVPGGSGTRPDWEVCAQIVDSHPGRKFVLAGGLTAENVADALETVRPWGVDVSSGIEGSRGVKDVAKMRAFVAAVEAFESTHA